MDFSFMIIFWFVLYIQVKVQLIRLHGFVFDFCWKLEHGNGNRKSVDSFLAKT